MWSTAKLLFAASFLVHCVLAQSSVPAGNAKAVVLQKDEGELRTRRPRKIPVASSDFLLKVSPRTNGSKHFLLGTEEIPPGHMIPRHKHHGEDEILLIQTGNAHVWLGDKEYDAKPGAVVFIPADTWISLKNTGTENIDVVFVFNEPSFEEMLLCSSVPKGQPAEPLSDGEVKTCYHYGDAELENPQP